MKIQTLLGWVGGLLLATSSHAAGFVNGGFDDGTYNGWTIGGGNRAAVRTENLTAADYLPGGTRYDASVNAPGPFAHTQVVSPGLDPILGSSMANIVYGGSNSLRVEDSGTGAYLSVASQVVRNYTDSNIFFAWMAVLQNGGHQDFDSAAMIIELTDLTTNTKIIQRIYNAADGGGDVDSRFSSAFNDSVFYTADWQIEQLAIDSSLLGHDFQLSVLAADCAQGGHYGYVYLDGFGAVAPPVGDPTVPEPSSLLLFGAAFAGLVGVSRRRRASK